MKISATNNKTNRSLEVEIDLGSNLQEAVELFTEEVVFSQFKAAAVVAAQGVIRRNLGDSEKTDEQVTEIAENWKPGMKTVKAKSAKIKDVAKMSTEDLMELKAKLLAEIEARAIED